MEQADNLMRENLIFLLQNMDIAFVQRISDFAYGILNAPASQETDWWHELTKEQQERLNANLDALKNGTAKMVSGEEARNRINQLLATRSDHGFNKT